MTGLESAPYRDSGVNALRVLVTGAGGMIGSAVVRLLAEHGAVVHASLGPPTGPVVNPPPGVPGSVADITDLHAITALVHGMAAVVHLAGPPSVADSFVEPIEHARVHVVGTATLLEACRTTGVRRLVHVSSAEVYGAHPAGPVGEDATTRPRSPYGAAKLGAEALVRALCPTAGIDGVVLRPFSVYGPRSPDRSLIGSLVRQALYEDRVQVQRLDVVRDYVHVDDVAAAVLRALITAQPGMPVYNVATGVGTSVAALAQRVVTAAGRNVPVVAAAPDDRPRVAEVRELVADVSLIRRELAWVPSVSLEAGIGAMLQALTA